MKILATSDIHGNLPTFDDESADILIISGDLTILGKRDYLGQAQWINNKFDKWCGKMRDRFEYIVVIAGNHDVVCDRAPHMLQPFQNFTYLQDSSVTIDGVNIWGTPWTIPFFDWGFNGRDEVRQAHFDQIPDDTDIIITHGPPRIGALDKVQRVTQGVISTELTGDPIMNDVIERVRPSHVFCGHIHEGAGLMDYIGDTAIHNVCYVDERYIPFVDNPSKYRGWKTLEI